MTIPNNFMKARCCDGCTYFEDTKCTLESMAVINDMIDGYSVCDKYINKFIVALDECYSVREIMINKGSKKSNWIRWPKEDKHDTKY